MLKPSPGSTSNCFATYKRQTNQLIQNIYIDIGFMDNKTIEIISAVIYKAEFILIEKEEGQIPFCLHVPHDKVVTAPGFLQAILKEVYRH